MANRSLEDKVHKDDQAPRSRSENSDAYIPYYLGGPLEDEKMKFWVDMRQSLLDLEKSTYMMNTASRGKLANFVTKAIRTFARFILAWHAEMLDQRRFMLTMCSEMEYRQERTLRKKIPTIMMQFRIWRGYTDHVRRKPSWLKTTWGQVQKDYTKVQKKIASEIEIPERDLTEAFLEVMIADNEGLTLREIRKIVRSSTPNETPEELNPELQNKLVDFALAKGFSMEDINESSDV
jgi:hypothetical protein